MQTGKDTLYKQMNEQIRWNWLILAKSCEAKFNITRCQKIAFAKILKEICYKNLVGKTVDDVESVIENYKAKPISALIGSTKYDVQYPNLRSYLIDTANKMREEDPDIFVRMATENLDPTQTYMVTDWRFPNELNYIKRHLSDKFNIVTIRVFRSAVPIPTIEMEHLLDKMNTDYILVLLEGFSHELAKLHEYFPQYRNYTICYVERLTDL